MTKSETQLTLHKIAHRFGVRPDIEPAFNKAIEALFQQALTSLRSEMEELKVATDPPIDKDDLRNELVIHNTAISECQKLLEDKLNNGGTQHE